MSRDFDEEIKTAEESLKATLLEMNQVQESFINAAVEFLKPFWFQQAEFIAKASQKLLKV